MNNDLISRSALIKWIDDSVSQYGHTYSTDMLNIWGLFKDYLINNAPTVDIKPFASVTFDKEELNKIVEERIIEPIKRGELVIRNEWIPLTKRPITDDEWEELSDEAKDYIDEDEKWFFDCPMPEDGQNIIISTKWGVRGDTCEISAEGGLNAYYLEENGDWDGVLAWMPMPKPYKEGGEGDDK